MYNGLVLTVDIDLDRLAEALAERLQQQAPAWLSVAQAAEHLGCSERWLRGRLPDVPHSRVEGRIFLSRAELDRWLLAQSA